MWGEVEGGVKVSRGVGEVECEVRVRVRVG